jgi:transcription factor E
MEAIDNSLGSVLGESLGSESLQVISVIDYPIEDKDISSKIELETSRVRIILNDLLEKNLVHLDRERLDTGYTYYRWVRREDKLREFANNYIEKRMKELDEVLLEQERIMFECGCKRIEYSDALDMNFSCDDCGKDMKNAKGVKGARKIKAELKRLDLLRSNN